MHSCVCFDVKKQVNTFTARSFHSLEAPRLNRLRPGETCFAFHRASI